MHTNRDQENKPKICSSSGFDELVTSLLQILAAATILVGVVGMASGPTGEGSFQLFLAGLVLLALNLGCAWEEMQREGRHALRVPATTEEWLAVAQQARQHTVFIGTTENGMTAADVRAPNVDYAAVVNELDRENDDSFDAVGAALADAEAEAAVRAADPRPLGEPCCRCDWYDRRAGAPCPSCDPQTSRYFVPRRDQPKATSVAQITVGDIALGTEMARREAEENFRQVLALLPASLPKEDLVSRVMREIDGLQKAGVGLRGIVKLFQQNGHSIALSTLSVKIRNAAKAKPGMEPESVAVADDGEAEVSA